MNSVTAESARSRPCTCSRTTSRCSGAQSPYSSRVRLRRRASSSASSRTRTSASGQTTVVMSLPSAIMPDPWARASIMRRRCSCAIHARTRRFVETCLMARAMRGSRIAAVTSASPTHTCGSWGSESRRRRIRSAREATSSAEPSAPKSTPDSRANHVSARYMAPVSRYPMPAREATALETVDLPEPAGPSIAIVMPRRPMAALRASSFMGSSSSPRAPQRNAAAPIGRGPVAAPCVSGVSWVLVHRPARGSWPGPVGRAAGLPHCSGGRTTAAVARGAGPSGPLGRVERPPRTAAGGAGGSGP